VLQEIELDDKCENMGAQWSAKWPQGGRRRPETATTTATVLAAAIVRERRKSVATA